MLIKLSSTIFLFTIITIFSTGAFAEYYIENGENPELIATPCHKYRVVHRYRTHCYKKRHHVRRHHYQRPIIKVIRYRPAPSCDDDCVSTGCTTCREYDREGAIYSPANCC